MPELAGLRGFSAFYVVAFHAVMLYDLVIPSWDHPLSRALLAYGWVGVDLFFVLSGFLLALPLVARPSRVRQAGFWPDYLVRRFTRIAPPYYASILLATLLVGSYSMFAVDGWNLLRHVLYIHNFWQESFITMHPVAWTLALEAQFYLLLPLVVPLFAGRRWHWVLAATLLLTAAFRWWAFVPGDAWLSTWRSSQLPGFALHFALGITAARLYLDGWRLPTRGRVPVLVAVAAVVAGLGAWSPAGSLFGSAHPVGHVVLRPLVGLASALVVFAAVTERGLLSRCLQWRPMAHAGEISYSVYLMHLPFSAWILVEQPVMQDAGFLAFVGAALLASWGGGTLLYWLAERPSLLLKGTLTRRTRRDSARPEPPPALATTTAATPTPESE